MVRVARVARSRTHRVVFLWIQKSRGVMPHHIVAKVTPKSQRERHFIIATVHRGFVKVCRELQTVQVGRYPLESVRGAGSSPEVTVGRVAWIQRSEVLVRKGGPTVNGRQRNNDQHKKHSEPSTSRQW